MHLQKLQKVRVLQICEKPSISPNSTKHTLIKENMSYETFGENKVFLPYSDRMSGLESVRSLCNGKPYVWLNTIRPLYGFSGRTSFSLQCPPILRLLRLLGTP
jgi:hypothetical protein